MIYSKVIKRGEEMYIKKIDKEKKNHPALWKIQLYVSSFILSVLLLFALIAITMVIIYWF